MITLSEARERANAAARTKYLDWRHCDYACNVFDEILYEADDVLKSGDVREAFSLALFIFHKCMWLASYADSSSGLLGMTTEASLDLVSRACESVEDNGDKQFIFRKCLNEAKDKVHDGWDDHYTLLRHAAKLVDKANLSSLEAVLEELRAREDRKNQEHYSSWHARQELLVRLDITRYLEGIPAYRAMIMDHLDIDEVRVSAIELAAGAGEYTLAEELCNGGIEKAKDYHWSKSWYVMLTDLYRNSNQEEKYISLLKERLLAFSDADVFDALKEKLIEKNAWDSYYETLLNEMESRMRIGDYLGLIAKCGENARLLEGIKNHPDFIEYYFEQLAVFSPEDAFPLYSAHIEKAAERATERRFYRRVCKDIKTLYDHGGKEEANRLIEKFEAKFAMHPGRRPAMLDELAKIRVRLGTKRK